MSPLLLRLLNPVVLPDFRLKRREGLKAWAFLTAVIRLETCAGLETWARLETWAWLENGTGTRQTSARPIVFGVPLGR